MRRDSSLPGFFPVIFGSLSSIPREQPIRDNLETIARQSREMADLRQIIEALRPEIEETVDRLFGSTFFIDHPTPKRLAAWRKRAQQAAFEQAGFAYHGYAQVKFNGIVATLAKQIFEAAPQLGLHSDEPIRDRLIAHFAAAELDRRHGFRDARSPTMIAFFRDHDLAFRIRRLRLLARRVTQEREEDGEATEQQRDCARTAIYDALTLYLDREPLASLGPQFPGLAHAVFEDPAAVVEHIVGQRRLPDIDAAVDELLCRAMADMPSTLRRRMLFDYLGFPLYDTVTLPLLRSEALTELDPVLVDRISPEDCHTIRRGGTEATLRGVEFYNFGAFFSRAYRENDYLWGRLHGAERVIDLICSTLDGDKALPHGDILHIKKAAFLAILDEEEARLMADPTLVPGLRGEVEALGH